MNWIKKTWFGRPQMRYLKGFFTEDECNLIISDFEKNEEHIKISKDHGLEGVSSYEISEEYFSDNIKQLISDKIGVSILPHTNGYVGMVFGVRYSLDTKPDMKAHYDCNELSSIISLNNDYEGGGTYFPLSGGVYKPNTGDGYMFNTNKINSYHAGHPITKGVRYVLVVRIYRQSVVRQVIDSLFLFFIDKYNEKRKLTYYKEPKKIKINTNQK